MDKKINIADILQDKPQGTKLYSPAFGDVALDIILGNKDYCIQIIDVDHNYYALTEFGLLSKYGKCMLFPSLYMQDWDRYSWKKGDVLKGVAWTCIFKEWNDRDYTRFNGVFFSDNYNFKDTGVGYFAGPFVKASADEAKAHIERIEKYYGGKLNFKTLEIEKPQFKDGDIVVLEGDGKSHNKIILLYKSNIDDEYEVYSFLNTETSYLSLEAMLMDDRKARPATEEEKQQLFTALKKEGKRWNSETKTLEDLPKKCEFKPFDKVLSRMSSEYSWRLNIYSHKTKYYHICIDGSSNQYCVPYNEQTAHLLGTTDDWEGGEE